MNSAGSMRAARQWQREHRLAANATSLQGLGNSETGRRYAQRDQCRAACNDTVDDGGTCARLRRRGWPTAGPTGPWLLAGSSKKMRKYGTKVAAVGGAAALGGLAYSSIRTGRPAVRPRSATHPSTPCRAMRWMPAPPSGARHGGGGPGRRPHRRRRAPEDPGVPDRAGERDAARWIDADWAPPSIPRPGARGGPTWGWRPRCYLASLLTIEVDHVMERGYLDELARALKLDDNLKEQHKSGRWPS